MKLNQIGAGLSLTLMLASAGAALAAPRDDTYYRDRNRDRRPDIYRSDDNRYGRPGNYRRDDEREHRSEIQRRVARISEAVHVSRRRGNLSSRDADRLISRLDRVSDFVLKDRNFSDEEFRRRMSDLDDIQRDLSRVDDRRNDRRDDRRSDDRGYGYGRR